MFIILYLSYNFDFPMRYLCTCSVKYIMHFIRRVCERFSLGLDCRPLGETACQDFLGILPGWEFYYDVPDDTHLDVMS